MLAEPRTRRRTLPDWLAASITMVLAFLIAALVLHLFDADLHEPFAYRADANSAQMVVKSVLDHGWYEHNSQLGYPFGQDLGPYAFVSGDNLQILILSVIGLFTGSAALAMNLFFLLGFPICAATAFVVLRAWRLSQLAAATGALLFALLPYHFLHGEMHLFISAYYAVPLGVYLIVAAWQGDALFSGRPRHWILLIAAACLVIGSAHVYYAAFVVLLAGLAALVRGLSEHSLRRVLALAAPALLVLVVVAANHAPNIVWSMQHDSDPALTRSVGESEQYGLKAAPMLLPVRDHRLAPLAHLRERYDNGTQSQTGEGDAEALGTLAALGVLGLIALLLVAVVRGGTVGLSSLPGALGATTLTAFLLGTIGGGSALFALIATPSLRAWARVSIVIAFCGVAAVALALDWAAERFAFSPFLAAAAALVLVVVGVLDQTNAKMAPDYNAIDASWSSDGALVAGIERTLPSGSAVFELPYQPFPEPQITFAPPPDAAQYDGVRPYLHSKRLKWSFGEVKGLHGNWQFALASQPAQMVPGAAAAVGFKGLLFDRGSYVFGGRAVEREIAATAGVKPLVSRDHRFAFYDLRPLDGRLRAKLGAPRMRAAADATLDPLQVGWSSSGLKSGVAHAYRLANGEARANLFNPSKTPRQAQVSTAIEPLRSKASRTATRTVSVAPGGTASVRFAGNGPLDALLPDVGQPFNMRLVDPFVADVRQLPLLDSSRPPGPPAILLTPYRDQ